MFSLRCYVALLRTWRRRCFHGINAMILCRQISDVIANENARYKRNELEYQIFDFHFPHIPFCNFPNSVSKNCGVA